MNSNRWRKLGRIPILSGFQVKGIYSPVPSSADRCFMLFGIIMNSQIYIYLLFSNAWQLMSLSIADLFPGRLPCGPAAGGLSCCQPQRIPGLPAGPPAGPGRRPPPQGAGLLRPGLLRALHSTVALSPQQQGRARKPKAAEQDYWARS